MAQVLVKLRIPSLMVRAPDRSAATRIDNSAVRFLKRVEVPAIPRVGAILAMTGIAVRAPFHCTVNQVEWDERQEVFVVRCRYGPASIREVAYRELLASADWVTQPLL
jgi:hypothetical protein